MGAFQKWADKRLYSCTLVVAVLGLKIGPYLVCNVTLS